VSSINWVRPSVLSNREVGVIVKDRPLSNKASEVFMSDWASGVTGGEGGGGGGSGGGGGAGNNTTGEEDIKEQIPFPGGPLVIVAIAIATVILDVRWRGRRGHRRGGGSSGI